MQAGLGLCCLKTKKMGGGGGGGGVNLGAIQNVYIFIYCSLIFIPYLLSVNTVYK